MLCGRAPFIPLEIGGFHVDATGVGLGEPAQRIQVVTVHLGQHAVGGAKVVRPGRGQARAVSKGFDHHHLTDLARVHPLRSEGELGIEPAHKA